VRLPVAMFLDFEDLSNQQTCRYPECTKQWEFAWRRFDVTANVTCTNGRVQNPGVRLQLEGEVRNLRQKRSLQKVLQFQSRGRDWARLPTNPFRAIAPSGWAAIGTFGVCGFGLPLESRDAMLLLRLTLAVSHVQ
jgi:hypothetical protein